MRTTCPKCKKGQLVLVRDIERIERILTTEYGHFDAHGDITIDDTAEVDREEIDREEIDREEIDAPEVEDGESSQYVQCEKCSFIVMDHPLSTIDEDRLDGLLDETGRKRQRAKHHGAKVSSFEEARERIRKAQLR